MLRHQNSPLELLFFCYRPNDCAKYGGGSDEKQRYGEHAALFSKPGAEWTFRGKRCVSREHVSVN